MRAPCLPLVLLLACPTASTQSPDHPAPGAAMEPGDEQGLRGPMEAPGITVSPVFGEEVEHGGPHRHEVVVDLGRTPRRRVRVEVELIGARRGTRLSRHVALGAMSFAAAIASPPAARAMTPLVATVSDRLAASGEAVFMVKGKRLRRLGGGAYLLKFRCVHIAGLDAKARITVRAQDRKGRLLWKVRTPWKPLGRESAAAPP